MEKEFDRGLLSSRREGEIDIGGRPVDLARLVRVGVLDFSVSDQSLSRGWSREEYFALSQNLALSGGVDGG